MSPGFVFRTSPFDDPVFADYEMVSYAGPASLPVPPVDGGGVAGLGGSVVQDDAGGGFPVGEG